jgi:hypothetical protein
VALQALDFGVLIPRLGFYDPSMWGFNVSMQDYPYDNRPMAPLQQYTFEQWWFVSGRRSIMWRASQTLTLSSPLARALSSPP